MYNSLITIDAEEFLSRLNLRFYKLVYLNPPFNTGHDGSYYKKYSHHTEKDYLEFIELIIFHSSQILSDDGFLVVNTPNEYRCEFQTICQKILGKSNYQVEIIIPSKVHAIRSNLNNSHRSILIFKKSELSILKEYYLPLSETNKKRYKNEDNDERGPYIKLSTTISNSFRTSFEFNGITPKNNQTWRFSKEKMDNLKLDNRLIINKDKIYLKRYLYESNGEKLSNVWDDLNFHNKRIHNYDFSQPLELIERLIAITTNENDIIIDPFCGSGTSLIASLNLKRNWIGSDYNKKAISIIKQRVKDYTVDKKLLYLSRKKFFEIYTKKNEYHTNLKSSNDDREKALKTLSKKQYKRTLAIIISIENYTPRPKNQIPNVKYANKDANLFREMLIKNMGVASNDIFMFINESASKSNLEYEMTGLFHELEKNDRLIFYYVGHGFHNGVSNYLSTYDMHQTNIIDTSISLRDMFLDPYLNSKCTSALVFIDACATHIRDKHSRNIILGIDNKEFQIINNKNSYSATFFSCQPGQSSYSCDTLSHGIWTYYLNKALSGEVRTLIYNDKYITDRMLTDYLTKYVSEYAKENHNFTQNPKSTLDSDNEVIIVEMS